MYTAKKINCVATHKVCRERERERERETSAVTDFALRGTKNHVFCPHKFTMKIIYQYF